MLQTANDRARKHFSDSGLTYSDISSREIAKLQEILKAELSTFVNGKLKMSLVKPKARDIKYKDDGSIEHIFFKVNSFYFKNREAISFNPDGFIGIAGWSDSTNVEPFINALTKWINEISK